MCYGTGCDCPCNHDPDTIIAWNIAHAKTTIPPDDDTPPF